MSEENKDSGQESGGAPAVGGSDVITVEKPAGRRKCPKCNNENKAQIHESVDKETIIMDYPKVYGKKYLCGLCGCKWREK